MTDSPSCILVVDDEADFRDIVRLHLEDRGCRVFSAQDGVEALAIFEEKWKEIDLVITDMRMPRMGGEELVRRIHAICDYLPIIGITGHLDVQATLSMLDHGAYYYLHKPLDPWAIVDRLIENAVRIYRVERELRCARKRELAIGTFVQGYMMSHPVSREGVRHKFQPEIAVYSVERPSGNFAEWFERTRQEIVFYVMDVAGHDDLVVSFMALFASLVLHRHHHLGRPALDRLISTIDDAFWTLRQAGAVAPDRFTTMFLGCVHLESGELFYVNAGNPEALLVSRDPRAIENVHCRRLAPNCPPVGLLLGGNPVIDHVRLEPGDLLFVYTGGASELLQGDDLHAKGVDRLEAVVKPLFNKPAQSIVDGIAAHLARQAGPAGLQDDTTLMAIKIKAAE